MKSPCYFLVAVGICLVAMSRLQAQTPAGPGPSNVLVVVNETSSASREIGRYYAQRRGIPAKNLCRIRVTEEEEISRIDYEKSIAKPVAACLRSGQLTEQIFYIVTTLGVPLRVSGDDGMTGEIAAVDSELTLLYQDLKTGRAHATKGPLSNPLFGKMKATFTHAEFPMYLVTRLAAYDVAGVKAMIDRSLLARNQGKFVIDLKSAEADQGNNWLYAASSLLPKDRLILDETDAVLYKQTNVIGFASWGSNDSNRHQRFVGFQWAPGAIATEFVSTNARTFKRPPADWNISDWKSPAKWWMDAPQTLTADYILEGASAATGHVYEPYLQMCPRPEYLLPAYYSGRNLAESFYLSIPALSWQNIVVGDPLMTLGK